MSRKSEVFNEDCMIGMRRYPDKYFDLAVVDPPYGGGGCGFSGKERFVGRFDRYSESVQDRGRMGEKIRKKNHSLGQRARQRIL